MDDHSLTDLMEKTFRDYMNSLPEQPENGFQLRFHQREAMAKVLEALRAAQSR